MLMDVEGRVAKERMGRARIEGSGKGALVFGNHGLQPEDRHKGAFNQKSIGLKQFEASKATTVEAPNTQGKRHIVMVHQQPKEMQKRLAGKIGVKKVKPEPRVEKEARTKPSISGQTAEQRARDQLRQAIHIDPSLSDVANKALDSGSTAAVLDAQKVVARRVAMKSAQKPDSKPMNREPPSSKSSVETPFATTNAAENASPHYHRKHVAPPSPQNARPSSVLVHNERRVMAPTPFDTKFSCSDYPEPPKVGVSSREQKRAKGFAEPVIDKSDHDSLAAKRAVSRGSRRDNAAMPDFIFGDVAPIKHKTSIAVKTAMPAGELPVRNRAIDPSKYRTTSLW